MCNNCNCSQARTNAEPSTTFPVIFKASGYIHNLILDEIAKHPQFPNMGLKLRYDIAKRVAAKHLAKIGIVDFSPVPFDLEQQIVNDIVFLKPTETIRKAVEAGYMSFAASQIWKKILAITKSDKEFSLKIQHYNEISGYVQALKTISERDRQALLISLEIANASERYWTEVAANQNSPYFPIIHSLPTNAQYKPKWWDIIAAGANCLGCAIVAGAGCIGCAVASSSLVSSLAGETKDAK